MKGKVLLLQSGYHASAWENARGKVIDSLLEHTPLIDAQYLVALHHAGGIVPRGQAVPKAALIGPHNAWRLTWGQDGPQHAVVVLSYPWLDKEHPDREGEQLAKIAPILEIAIDGAKRARDGIQVIDDGKHHTVGDRTLGLCVLAAIPTHAR